MLYFSFTTIVWPLFLFLLFVYFYIQKQDFKMALRKYRKALRYLDVCWELEDIDEGEPFALLDRVSLLAFIIWWLYVLWFYRDKLLFAEDQVSDIY